MGLEKTIDMALEDGSVGVPDSISDVMDTFGFGLKSFLAKSCDLASAAKQRLVLD